MAALKAFIENLRPDQQERLGAIFNDLHEFNGNLDGSQQEFLQQENLDGLAKDILRGDAAAVYFGKKHGEKIEEEDAADWRRPINHDPHPFYGRDYHNGAWLR